MEFHSVCLVWIISFIQLVRDVMGGECCTFTGEDEYYCKNYCCGLPFANTCCDVFLLQADSENTSSICLSYFKDQYWILLLAIGGSIAIFVCVCIICVRACRSNSRPVIIQSQPQPSVAYIPQPFVH